MTEDELDLPTWLENVQRDMGITYTDDTAEEKLRSVFQQLLSKNVSGHANNVTYFGYIEQPQSDETRLRTTLKTLHADIELPDGSRYHLQLTGPYGTGK